MKNAWAVIEANNPTTHPPSHLEPNQWSDADMPVTMKINPAHFFQVLANSTGKPAIAWVAKDLMAHCAVTFTFSFSNITASIPGGKQLTLQIPTTTSSIMQLHTPKSVLELTGNQVLDFLHSVKQNVSPAYVQFTNAADAAEEKAASASVAMESVAMESMKASAAMQALKGALAMEARVHLSDATALNQPVFGSSDASMYRVVGLGKNVNVAARLSPEGSLSVRVEGTFNPDITTALAGLGFKANDGGHWSSHFKVTDVPPQRVLGAILFTQELELVDRLGSMKELLHGAG